MPNTIRPGDVLADRYRLVDLLSESGGGRFWRAHDSVLERHVALHVIRADDERAPGLLEAARHSATIPDRRLLRVLDADEVNGLCYVVNEWGNGRSLDVILANDGPLGARRAAWLVSEVAGSIAVAHDAGLAHGRLVPENVLVERSGSIRVIGFSVDAALHGLPPGRPSGDVADLGGLLYVALTGRWPGTSPSEVAAAPHESGRVLRPRQVRAGIARPLDVLCDHVVNPAYASHAHLRSVHDLTTARGICDYLSDFVGDPSGMAEAEAAQDPGSRQPETVALPALPDRAAPRESPTAAAAAPDDVEPDQAHDESPAGPSEPDPAPAAPATPAVPDEQPTQAGLPIFDDENDDVSWMMARAEKAPPPPPFEPAPERPLFAPAPDHGQPARKTRPGAGAGSGSQTNGDYWPWDSSSTTGTGLTSVADDDAEDAEVPGRSWLRLAGAIAAGLLLLVAVVVAYNLGRGKTPLGAEPDSGATSSSPPSSQASAPTVISGVTAEDFDPQGDPPDENPDLVPLALDGDPSTAWRTMTYNQNLGPQGLKTGVGLTIDLQRSTTVSDVDLTTIGTGTDVSIYVTEEKPTGVRGLTPAARVSVKPRQQIALDDAPTGRYVTVWLTSLPPVDGRFRGEIAEVAVRG